MRHTYVQSNKNASELRLDGPSEAELRREYMSLIAKTPTKSEIFLPTERVPLTDKVLGMRRVHRIYSRDLDRIYRPQLRALRDACTGRDRCFIIGNGPSLNRTDLTKLKCEATFAVNGFFLAAQDLDWKPTFYVVEDHLVAEDRKSQIDALEGPIKLFPAYLGYCFEPAWDTVFFNHLPRKSYPHGFDFSTDAAQATYTGCTVTFTCMQLAFYLGFRQIYLIGVDSDYAIPKDVERHKAYGVGVLDMKSDDPNHFDPNYFGKGYRWHDPQVDKMIEAYQEARKTTELTGTHILNATVGGKLEVFDRAQYDSLFSQPASAEHSKQRASHIPVGPAEPQDGQSQANPIVTLPEFPRLLVIDQTLIGDGTATGGIKRSLFKTWPQSRFLQIYRSGILDMAVHGLEAVPGFDPSHVSVEDAMAVSRGFAPQAILYRPTPNQPILHEAALAIIDQLKVPLVIWMMDDWPASLERAQPGAFQELDRDVRSLLVQARLRLSICDEMSAAFEERYDVPFKAFANGIDPDDWPAKSSIENRAGPLRVRYAGSLAHDMTLDSVLRIARTVEELAAEGLPVTFEIKTQNHWWLIARQHFKKFKKTSVLTDDLSEEDYRCWLCDADIVVVACNFDKHSLEYIKYSRSNKLPECLASGAALLAHGPAGLPTIDFVVKHRCGAVVSTEELSSLKDTLRGLIRSDEERMALVTRARATVFAECDLRQMRQSLREEIAVIANPLPNPSETCQALTQAFPRSAQVGIDETEVVAELFPNLEPVERVMVDVGAHVGSSARYFAKKDWTVHCFEPDPENRKELSKSFEVDPKVKIDSRAVGEQVQSGLAFFRSEESTGISSLLPFRDTHEEVAKVDVTTIAEIIRERDLNKIDFLKIDVEGWDFSVLKGVPWESIRPSVIECEFEDTKTIKLGVTYKDMADYLVEKGYTVYVSEWHPVIRYGSPHNWYRLKRYPCELAQTTGWGNLLAFRNDPGESQLAEAFNAHLKTRKVSTTRQSQVVVKQMLGPVVQSFIRFRSLVGNRLRMSNPRLYAMAARAERRILLWVR